MTSIFPTELFKRQVASELAKLREGQATATLARAEAQDARAAVLKQEGHGQRLAVDDITGGWSNLVNVKT